MNFTTNQPAFATPLTQSGLARGCVLAMAFNRGGTFNDAARVAGDASVTIGVTSLAYGVGRYGHYTELDVAGANESIHWPNSSFVQTGGGMTVSMLYEKSDATIRNAISWGVDVGLAGATYYCYGLVPYVDGTVYFDYGGNGGANRLTAGGLSFGADHWIFSTGPRGMEIWQNGTKVASNANNPTRSRDVTHPFKLGAGNFTNSDIAKYYMFSMWDRQIETKEILVVNANPYALWETPQRFFALGSIFGTFTPPSPTAGAGDGVMEKWGDTLFDASGRPLSGAQVTVKLAGTSTIPTLYADRAGLTTRANPLTCDANGSYEYYAPNGRYDITVSSSTSAFDSADSSDLMVHSPMVRTDIRSAGTPASLVETTLLSATLPAYSLSGAPQVVRVTAYGTTAANANPKRARLYVGGTVVADSSMVPANNTAWRLEALVTRTAPHTQKVLGTGQFNGSETQATYYALGVSDTAAVTVILTGENGVANANDIMAEALCVRES